jgi:hypothetical protein
VCGACIVQGGTLPCEARRRSIGSVHRRGSGGAYTPTPPCETCAQCVSCREGTSAPLCETRPVYTEVTNTRTRSHIYTRSTSWKRLTHTIRSGTLQNSLPLPSKSCLRQLHTHTVIPSCKRQLTLDCHSNSGVDSKLLTGGVRLYAHPHRRCWAGDKGCRDHVIIAHDVGTIQYIEWLILIERVQPSFITGVSL